MICFQHEAPLFPVEMLPNPSITFGSNSLFSLKTSNTYRLFLYIYNVCCTNHSPFSLFFFSFFFLFNYLITFFISGYLKKEALVRYFWHAAWKMTLRITYKKNNLLTYFVLNGHDFNS